MPADRQCNTAHRRVLSEQRDTAAARRFLVRALSHGPMLVEVTTDKAGPYLRVLDQLVPAAAHLTEQYETDEKCQGPVGGRFGLLVVPSRTGSC